MSTADANSHIIVIGVTGGSSSGKNSVSKMIAEDLTKQGHGDRICTVLQEYFYKEKADIPSLATSAAGPATFVNYDHPSAIDDEAMLAALRKLKSGESVEVYPHDFKTNTRSTEPITIPSAQVILVSGSLLWWFPEVRDICDMKIFVDTDSDTRLSRRVMRDMALGRSLESILNTYVNHVKPAFEDFVLPMKKHADLILPRGPDNLTAINLIIRHIRLILGDATPSADTSPEVVRRHSSVTIVAGASQSPATKAVPR